MTPWTILDPWAPFIHVWWIEPQLRAVPPSDTDIQALAAAILSQADTSRAATAADSIVAAETARLDSLERKLDAQRTVLTAILPFAVILLGWAAREKSLAGGVASIASITYVVLGYLIATRGSSTSQRYLLSAEAFRSSASAPNLGTTVSATRLEFAVANQRYGVRLANYIWATQRMAMIAALTFGLGACVMFVAGSTP